MDTNEIKQAVEAYLAKHGVTFSAVCLGERTRDGWKCDAWRVAFQKGDGRELLEDFDYFTGTGHRRAPAWGPGPGMFGIYDGTAKPPRAGTLLYESWQRLAKPVAPHAADVLHSLALDSSAATQTFADWCSDFGYDTDSRKALATYETCQQAADKLTRVFGRGCIEEIQQLTEGY
jgi:hypothetical protein